MDHLIDKLDFDQSNVGPERNVVDKLKPYQNERACSNGMQDSAPAALAQSNRASNKI